MRKSLIFCLLTGFILLMSHKTYSQIEFGLKAGMSSMDLISESIQAGNGMVGYELSFHDASYGHHLGLYSRVSFLGIYLEPAFIFNSNKVDYTLKSYTESGVFRTIVSERYQSLDIPLMLGIKAGIFRMYAGPVAKLDISTQSGLLDFEGFGHAFNGSRLAFQTGFGLDIWRLRLELAYEGSLSRFGDHITIFGQEHSFTSNASRIMATVGYRF